MVDLSRRGVLTGLGATVGLGALSSLAVTGCAADTGVRRDGAVGAFDDERDLLVAARPRDGLLQDEGVATLGDHQPTRRSSRLSAAPGGALVRVATNF